jgi:beta-N-acetylhexosaminidase
MKLDKKKSGALMMDVDGLTITAQECEQISRPEVGGLILFARNYVNKNQLRDLVAAIRQCNPDIIIAVDQEGGRVQRFGDGFLQLPALHQIGKLHHKDSAAGLAAAKECGWVMAVELTDLGVDISFAPVLDLYNADSQVIAERAFAADPDEVIALGKAYMEGMGEAGMSACGKHYPGHGTVTADSHTDLPRDDRSFEEIRAADMKVFEACADSMAGVMPAHIIYPQVDDVCAGFSKVWVEGILRQQLGFDGVVFSDDLLMMAAHSAGAIEERAEQALQAGCDMLLVCNDADSASQVLDWLAQRSHPGSERIGRMRSKSAPGSLDFGSDRWLKAVEIVAQLHAID